jgi:hypothetical protein
MIAKHVRNCAEKWDLHPRAIEPKSTALRFDPGSSATETNEAASASRLVSRKVACGTNGDA